MKKNKKYWYTAVWGKRDSPIITIKASNVKEARKKILSELSKNTLRASYRSKWIKSKKKLIRVRIPICMFQQLDRGC